ncbi:MAG: HelD family protein [Ilumatobacteraceae bacterium]
MTARHPDLPEEQAFIDHAYECLESSRQAAWRLRDLNEADLGGTFQARFERNAFDEALVKRLTDLDLGDSALVFGRIDRVDESGDDDGTGVESFRIGRLAVADDQSEPVVIDWRAPVAEPFYRATGREPMGLLRRRHFAVEGRTLLGLEDELFGEGHLGLGDDEGLSSSGPSLRGYSTLIASLERGRTGALGDIVATIQAEQDEIIRSPQAGVLVVQGGPGTGKTVVALHRAAYLLYTHRFPLEDQGVLVIGPNRVFLRYIERVLPSLGEAGVEQVVLADLVPGVAVSHRENPEVAAVKGDVRMTRMIDRAVDDRERPLREDLVVPFRSGYLRLTVEDSRRIVRQARRRNRRHNASRRIVENEMWETMAAGWRAGDAEPREVREAVRRLPEVREALERMWPVLTPAQLVHDLLGSKALLRSALTTAVTDTEVDTLVGLLHRSRSASPDDIPWTEADIPLLDDAREVLGPVPHRGEIDPADEIRTYGHIVVDEVQDLTPMALRMVTRRSLNGSMTVVGDLAQATGALAPAVWDDVVAHLPDRRPPRVIGLSVGYRIPSEIMAVADVVMEAAAPGLRRPESVRSGGEQPRLVPVEAGRAASVAGEVAASLAALPDGSVAVIAPDSMVDEMSEALTSAGIDHGRAGVSGLERQVTVVPVSVAKGLELDSVVVVEPASIVDEGHLGLRSLYVALTRSTRRLAVVHSAPLPEPLAVGFSALSAQVG